MKKIILIGGILLALTLTVVFGIYQFNKALLSEFNNSEPKEFAIEKAINHKEVIHFLGDEITILEKTNEAKKKGKFTFSLSSDGFDMEQKSVDLKMKLYGKKEEAFLKVVAFKENSKWVYEELYVHIPTINKRIQLLNAQQL